MNTDNRTNQEGGEETEKKRANASRLTHNGQRLGLAVLSGILLAASFRPWGWWPLILGAWVPLFFAIRDVSPRRAFYLGLLQGAIGYGLALWWFMLIFKGAALALYLILALFVALACNLTVGISRRFRNPWWMMLSIGTVWTGLEFFRSEIYFLRFPWITPGLAVGPTWLTPLLGVYGMSFLVFLAAAALSRPATRKAGAVLTTAVLVLGIIRPGPVIPDTRDAITVCAVQSEQCRLQSYLELTPADLPGSRRLILWPEYAVPYNIRSIPSEMEQVLDLAFTRDAVVIMGTKTPVSTETTAWYNTALTVDATGVLGEHYKNRPVHFFDDGTPGRTALPVDTPLGRIGTPICFDCDYTAVIRHMAFEGAVFLAVPSFDARHWSAFQHRQHADMFRLRAAETGRWIVVAATSGISQIIDPHGNVTAHTEPMAEGVLTGTIAPRTGRTPYVVWGWLFPWACMLCTVGLLGFLSVVTFRNRHRPLRTGAAKNSHEL